MVPDQLDHGNGDGIHEVIQLMKRGMTEEQIRTAGELADRTSEAVRPHLGRHVL